MSTRSSEKDKLIMLYKKSAIDEDIITITLRCEDTFHTLKGITEVEVVIESSDESI